MALVQGPIKEGFARRKWGTFKDFLYRHLGDPDDVLAFQTPKVVKVRDWRLGAINYACQLAIFIYICVQIFSNQQYNFIEDITGGQLYMTTKEPPRASTYPYCCQPTEPEFENTTLSDWFATATCDDAISNGGYTAQKPCLNWGHYSAEFPVGLYASSVVTTRVKISSTESNCTQSRFGGNCATFSDLKDEGGAVSASQFYVAGAEDFTILLRHAVKSQYLSTTISGSNTGSGRMSGSLRAEDDDTKELKHFGALDSGSPFVEPTKGDIISFQELLDAVHIGNHSMPRDDPVNAGQISSRRYDGLNIVVYIKYEQSKKIGDNSIVYTYVPKVMADLEYKVESIHYEDDGRKYEIYNRHGIRVTFIQSGKFYEFDFSVLLTTLVTSLALLAVSSTLVNLLMTHVLPMKALYKDHKYEVTEDFSLWRDNKGKFEREKVLAEQRNAGTLEDNGVGDGAITKDAPWNEMKESKMKESEI